MLDGWVGGGGGECLYGSRGFEARVVHSRRLSASLIWAIESHGACLATKENHTP